MTKSQKMLIAAALATAIGVGTYQTRQSSLLRAQIKKLQSSSTSEQARQSSLASLQARVKALEAQNGELSSALGQVNAEKARIEAEREQARRRAALYEELVEQTNSKDMNPTNEYPTQTHVWAAFGRLGRLGALSKEDDSKLSQTEKSALDAARTTALEDLPNLVKAAKEYQAAKPSQPDLQWDDLVDEVACILYGALNLDGQQFNQVYGVMQNLREQAKQKGLSKATPAPEATEATKQIMDQFKAQIQALLTPEQARIFTELVTHFQVEPGKFGYNFSF